MDISVTKWPTVGTGHVPHDMNCYSNMAGMMMAMMIVNSSRTIAHILQNQHILNNTIHQKCCTPSIKHDTRRRSADSPPCVVLLLKIVDEGSRQKLRTTISTLLADLRYFATTSEKSARENKVTYNMHASYVV